MKAGPLRHFVTIERPVRTRTGSGAVRDDFEPWLEDIHAEVTYISGTERWLTPQMVAAEYQARIRIRYRPGITAEMRARYRTLPGSPTAVDVFDIAAVVPADGRKVELHQFSQLRDAEGFRTGER